MKHVGNVRLRNTYRVESSPGEFRVSSLNSRGAEYGQLISTQIVDHLRNAARGQTISVDEAMRELVRSMLALPYRTGYKLRFFAQAVLVALVALGVATHTKVGHRFEYDIG